MGPLGDPNIEPKRKFRYLFAIDFCRPTRRIPPYFVRTVGRPSLTIEDTELNFLNSTTWIAGKPKWDSINVTYMDIDSGQNFELWSWIGTVYNFFSTNGVGAAASKPCYSMGRRSQYEGVGTLQSLDGCGGITEQFSYNNCWPTNIKFGDNSYEDSGMVDIEMTLRYSQVAYRNFCGPDPSPCPCTPCSTFFNALG